MGYKAAETNNR